MTSPEAVKESYGYNIPHFNSLCKYTEMKAACQIFFADLSRFGFVLLDASRLPSGFCHLQADNIKVSFR
jgi:hypothetical protein